MNDEKQRKMAAREKFSNLLDSIATRKKARAKSLDRNDQLRTSKYNHKSYTEHNYI